MVDAMEAGGVNCIDLYTPNPEFRSNLGHALRGRREEFILQAHLCTIWKDGQYKRTRDLAEVREGFDDQLPAGDRPCGDWHDPLCRLYGRLGSRAG